MANNGKNRNGSQVRPSLCYACVVLEENHSRLISLMLFLFDGQFFITTKADLTNLNDKHVVFGEVIEGLEVVDLMQNVEVNKTKNNKPLPHNEVVIVDCGQLSQ